MSPDRVELGFQPGPAPRRGIAAVAQFVAAIALVISLTVAVVVISAEIANAASGTFAAEQDPFSVAVAVLLGLLMAGIGGLTAIFVSRSPDGRLQH